MSKTQYEINRAFAESLKGGVIMDVTTPEQAEIAQAAGASAVKIGRASCRERV